MEEEGVDQRKWWAQRDGGRTGNNEGVNVGTGWFVCAHTHLHVYT